MSGSYASLLPTISGHLPRTSLPREPVNLTASPDYFTSCISWNHPTTHPLAHASAFTSAWNTLRPSQGLSVCGERRPADRASGRQPLDRRPLLSDIMLTHKHATGSKPTQSSFHRNHIRLVGPTTATLTMQASWSQCPVQEVHQRTRDWP